MNTSSTTAGSTPERSRAAASSRNTAASNKSLHNCMLFCCQPPQQWHDRHPCWSCDQVQACSMASPARALHVAVMQCPHVCQVVPTMHAVACIVSACVPVVPCCVCAPLIAKAPRSVAENEDREPWKDPMGVRTAAAMHTSASNNTSWV